MPTAVGRLDRALMRASAGIRSRPLDTALVSITSAADYSRLWLGAAGVLALSGGDRGRRAAARGLLALGLAAAVANGPAKLVVGRRRPSGRGSPALIDLPGSSSFPSGHTASAFAFAVGAGRKLPVALPILLPAAGVVGYSRVHTGVHYPSDVLAGALIGVSCGLLVGCMQRLGPRP